MGRPPIGKRAMSGAERVAKFRAKQQASKPVTKPVTESKVAELERIIAGQAAELARLQAKLATPPKAPKAPKPTVVINGDDEAAFQAAIDAEVRKQQRKLDIEFRQRVDKEVRRLVKPFRPFTEGEYKTILHCVHPDHDGGNAEAFRLWHERRDMLVKYEPTGGHPKVPPLPSGDELRAQAAARRHK